MFLQKTSGILQSLLGKYFEGIRAEEINISIWNGNLELKNLKLKLETINELDLPARLKSGFVGSMSLKVPWSKLGQLPVELKMENLFLLFEGFNADSGNEFDVLQRARAFRLKVIINPPLYINKVQVHGTSSLKPLPLKCFTIYLIKYIKVFLVAALFDAWTKVIGILFQNLEAQSLQSGNNDPQQNFVYQSWLKAFLALVIGNINVSISSVHIRYENDNVSNQKFAAGVHLASISTAEADSGRSGPIKQIKKVTKLKAFSVYLEPKIGHLTSETTRMKAIPQNSYILRPVSAVLGFNRNLETTAPKSEHHPLQFLSFEIEDLSLDMSEAQYNIVVNLVEQKSSFRQRLLTAYLRPKCSISENVKEWWKYAAKATVKKYSLTRNKFSWENLVYFATLRKKYLWLYIQMLGSQSNSVELLPQVKEIDERIPTELSLQWRLLAHNFWERGKSTNIERRSWWNFLMKDKGSISAANDFTDEDWNQLNTAVGVDSGMENLIFQRDGPGGFLHTLIDLHVKRQGIQLFGGSKKVLLKAELSDLKCVCRLYPKTIKLAVKLRSYEVYGIQGLVMKNVGKEGKLETLSVSFTYLPMDEDIDWALDVTSSACFFTYNKQTENDLKQFFQNKEIVSPSTALDTTIAFQAAVEELTKSAQVQLAEALKHRPKFKVNIKVDAPIVSIPSVSEKEEIANTNLVLDFGQLWIKTIIDKNEDPHSSDKTNVYLKFHLRGSDASALFVDGGNFWEKIKADVLRGKKLDEILDNSEDEDKFLTLLEPFNFSALVEKSWIQHPSLPSLRLGLQIPALYCHFSAGVYHKFLSVIESLRNEDNDTCVVPWDEAEFKSQISVLFWENMRDAYWVDHFVAIVGPFLYILASEYSRQYKHCLSLRGKYILEVPPVESSGLNHVLAISRGSSTWDSKLIDSKDVLLLKLKNKVELSEWKKHLQMAADRDAPVGIEAQKVEPKKDIEVFGVLNKFCLVISGMTADLPDKASVVNQGHGESELVTFQASDCVVDLSLSSENDMSVEFSVDSMEVEDLLQGSLSPACKYLIGSQLTSLGLSTFEFQSIGRENTPDDEVEFRKSGGQYIGSSFRSRSMGKNSNKTKTFSDSIKDSGFFDASDTLNNVNLRSSESFVSSSSLQESTFFFNAEDSLEGNSEITPFPESFEAFKDFSWFKVADKILDKGEKLVKGIYVKKMRHSSAYDGTDIKLQMHFAVLSLFCNRLTIDALLKTATRISGPIKDQSIEATNETSKQLAKGILGRGKDRTIFLLELSVEKAQMTLNGDDGLQVALLIQQNFSFNLSVFPTSFGLGMAMGNLRICDCSLGEGHKYGWVCETNPRNLKSFVKIDLKSFDPEEVDFCGLNYTVQASFDCVQIVYLHRFVIAVVDYMIGIAPKQAEEVIEISHGAVVQYFSQSQIEGLPAVLMEITFEDSSFKIPRNSFEPEYIQLHLSHVKIQNNIEWFGGNEESSTAVKVDSMLINLEGLQLCVGDGDRTGKQIVQELENFWLTCSRPLRDLWSKRPLLEIKAQIGKISGKISDIDYHIITECTVGNISEADSLKTRKFATKSANTNIDVPSGQLSPLEIVEDLGINSRSVISFAFELYVGNANLDLFLGKDYDSKLAKINTQSLTAIYTFWVSGKSKTSVSIPFLDVDDSRDGVPIELRRIITSSKNAYSHEHDTSSNASKRGTIILWHIDVDSGPDSFLCSVKTQQPRFVVTVDFLFALAAFFVPSIAASVDSHAILEGSDPIGLQEAVFLTKSFSRQKRDSVVELTPLNPLIVDDPDIDDYIYDGQGSCLRLCESDGNNLQGGPSGPLIIIGHGKRLKLKNISIENGEFLDLCVNLGNNSSYSALLKDGVRLRGVKAFPVSTEDELKKSETAMIPESYGEQKAVVNTTFSLQVVDLQAKLHDTTPWLSDSSLYPESSLKIQGSLGCLWTKQEMDEQLNLNLRRMSVKSSMGIPVIRKFDSFLHYSSSGPTKDWKLEIPNFFSNLTFHTIQLMLRIEQQILALTRANAEITFQCSQFSRIWVSKDDGGISFWRPLSPPGFVILGDCVTSSGSSPSQTVVALKNAFGRVKLPLAFQYFGALGKSSDSGENECSIWRPIPPEGYISLGFVVNPGSNPPRETPIFCVHKSFVTSTVIRDCLQFMSNNSSSVRPSHRFWRVENCVNSFVLENQETVPDHLAFDLRSQVINGMVSSVPQNIALISHEAKDPNLVETNNSSHSGGSHVEENYKLVPLERLWSSQIAPFNGVSFWRPNSPRGFSSVGDVVMKGSSNIEEGISGLSVKDIFLEKPLSFKRVFYSGKMNSVQDFALWFPIAPPGFVTLGTFFQLGKNPPSVEIRCCVQQELVMCADYGQCVWSTEPGKGKMITTFWSISNKGNTFLVHHSTTGKNPPKRLAFGLVDLYEDKGKDSVLMQVKTDKLSITILDDSRGQVSPLYDLTLSEMKFNLKGSTKFLDGNLQFTMMASSFNSFKNSWEPLIERWESLIRVQRLNSSCGKFVQSFRVVSKSPLNLNLSVDNMNHFLEALSNWNSLVDKEKGLKQRYSEIEKGSLSEGVLAREKQRKHRRSFVVLHNLLGRDIFLRILDEEGLSKILPMAAFGCASIGLIMKNATIDPSTNERIFQSKTKLLALRIIKINFLDKPILASCFAQGVRCEVSLKAQNSEQDGQTSIQKLHFESQFVTWNEVLLWDVSEDDLNLRFNVKSIPGGDNIGECTLSLDSLTFKKKDSIKTIAANDLFQWEKQEVLTIPVWLQNTKKIGELSISYVVSPGSKNEAPNAGVDQEVEAGIIEAAPKPFGPWTSVGSSYVEGPLSWKLFGESAVGEVVVLEGLKHVVLRSPVCVKNETQLPIEVSLSPIFLEGKGSAKKLFKGSDRSRRSLSMEESHLEEVLEGVEIQEKVFENQRYNPVLGWGSSRATHLLPLDPKRWIFLDSGISSQEFIEPLLPEGWIWTNDWQVEKSGYVDKDGWAYGFRFSEIHFSHLMPKNRRAQMRSLVRRRCWVRMKKYVPGYKPQVSRMFLGCLLPGEKISLPLSALSSEFVETHIQIRPCIATQNPSDLIPGLRTEKLEPDGESSFEWSEPLQKRSVGRFHEGLFFSKRMTQKEVVVKSLSLKEDKNGEDFQCSAYFSLSSMGLPVGVNSEMQPVYDWTLFVKSPLKLVNHLPIPGKFKLLEKGLKKGRTVKISGIVEPNSTVNLTDANPSKEIFLSWKLQDSNSDTDLGSVLIHHPYKDKTSSMVLVHGSRRLKINIRYECGEKENLCCPGTIHLSVPMWFSYEGCPPLNIRIVDMNRTSSAIKEKVNSGLRKTITVISGLNGSMGEKGHETEDRVPLETIYHDDDTHKSISLVGTTFTEPTSLGFCVGLTGEEGKVQFGPAVAISDVVHEENDLAIKAPGGNGECLRLSASVEVDQNDQEVKIINLHPYMVFSNRLGNVLKLRQPRAPNRVVTISSLESWLPSAIPESENPNIFQLALEESDWSQPFNIEEESQYILVKHKLSNEDLSVSVTTRKQSNLKLYKPRHNVMFCWGKTLPFRLENRSRGTILMYRQTGNLEENWSKLNPRSTVPFVWKDPSGFKALEVRPIYAEEESSRTYDIETLGFHEPLKLDSKPQLGSWSEREDFVSPRSGRPHANLSVQVVSNGIQKIVVFQDLLQAPTKKSFSVLSSKQRRPNENVFGPMVEIQEEKSPKMNKLQLTIPTLEPAIDLSPSVLSPGVLSMRSQVTNETNQVDEITPLSPLLFSPLNARSSSRIQTQNSGSQKEGDLVTYIVLDLPKLGVSLIDGRPQELLYVSAEGIHASFKQSVRRATDSFKFLMSNFQVDNQLPLTPHPVLLWSKNKKNKKSYIFKVKVVRDWSVKDWTILYPKIVIWTSEDPWELNIHEPIIWRLLSVSQSLHLHKLEREDAFVEVDPEVKIDRFSVEEVKLKVTLETSPLLRPKGILGIWSIFIDTIGNVSDIRLRLRRTCQERQLRQSQVVPTILSKVSHELIHQPLLNFLSGVDLLAMGRSGSSALSKSVAEFTENKAFIMLRSRTETVRRANGVAEGLLHGSEALSRAFYWGLTSPLRRPLLEYNASGTMGLVSGFTKGFADLVVLPVSGVIDFFSHSLEGADASLSSIGRSIQRKKPATRNRLPRAMGGHFLIVPYDKDRAKAQEYFQLAEVTLVSRNLGFLRVRAKFAAYDIFHSHFYLPEGYLLVITTLRVVLLKRGTKNHPFLVKWNVVWPNVLFSETFTDPLTLVKRQLLVHLRDTKDFGEAYVSVTCRDEAQAEEILLDLKESQRAFGPDRAALAQEFYKKRLTEGVRPSSASASMRSFRSLSLRSGNNSSIPQSMRPFGVNNSDFTSEVTLAGEDNAGKTTTRLFERLWIKEDTPKKFSGSTDKKQRQMGSTAVITIWKPLPPEGYFSVGDVLQLDSEFPSEVSVYKDTNGDFSHSTGFKLLWRNMDDGTQAPISIWMPLAPDGYVAMGCVVSDEYLEPESVMCIKKERVKNISKQAQHTWTEDKTRFSPWKISFYQVNNEARTFVAVRDEGSSLEFEAWEVETK